MNKNETNKNFYQMTRKELEEEFQKLVPVLNKTKYKAMQLRMGYIVYYIILN